MQVEEETLLALSSFNFPRSSLISRPFIHPANESSVCEGVSQTLSHSSYVRKQNPIFSMELSAH